MTKQQLADLIIGSKESFYRIAKSILSRDSDCEEAMSEAIVNAFTALPSLRQERYAKTWFTRILIHECYHILHRRQYEIVYDDRLDDAQSVPTAEPSALYQALEQLDVRYRNALVLHYIEGYSVREIADMTDATEGTVKSRLSRGRKLLKTIYEGE